MLLASESRSDQVRKYVASKNDGSEAAGDESEKKSGCDGVFHRASEKDGSLASRETTAPRFNCF
jgi:hypothetical protein